MAAIRKRKTKRINKKVQKKAVKKTPKKKSKKKITSKILTRNIRTPIRRNDFKLTSETNDSESESFRLADVLAGIRRELEAVALIAESEEHDVPRFHISKTEVDFCYSVASLSDKDGLRVAISKTELENIPQEKLHRLKVSLIDADVLSLEATSNIESE